MSADDDEQRSPQARRLDRNYGDLLQELRVAQTGVQILFAFLLTLPFQARFGQVDGFEKVIYLIALLAAAVAAALLIAPVAQHRILFRRGRKAELVRLAHRMASIGIGFVVISMVCSIMLVTNVVIGRPAAIALGALSVVWFVLLWLVLPFQMLRKPPIDVRDETTNPPLF